MSCVGLQYVIVPVLWTVHLYQNDLTLLNPQSTASTAQVVSNVLLASYVGVSAKVTKLNCTLEIQGVD